MDSQIKTSFIPKKPIETSAGINKTKKKGSTGRSIFSLIALIIFVGALVALGLAFFYKFTLIKKIEGQVASLQEAREEFDDRFIEQASRLSNRIKNSNQILENHVSPSSLFTLLEEYTLQSVSFDNFSITDAKDGRVELQGLGNSRRFESIVLQSDAFGRSEAMRNVIFTDVEPNLETNTVGFSFQATLDPRIILYKNSLVETFDNQENN